MNRIRSAEMYVADSSIHGLGLYAAKPISEGDYIGSYEGQQTREHGMHVLWVWDEKEDSWQGIEGENELRYLNHSNFPNAEFHDTELYAIRPITRDEEITFDYQWD